ncbi:MAG TPA: VOC family protein [Baekduia sp.]|uniref:VOC family protein n=1 Tax=Baekduia sp. TaxID=2600305 RepID=UPI002CA47A02|nr:VOC family protein [Baekduia sp.]HMJ34465.1 VOC family protein [Baekduia sp.]
MFDHVTIRVADRAVSERFFETVLTPLGIDTTYTTHAFTAWHDFMVTETDGDHPVTRGLHVAFSAPSREQVDAFWQAGVDAGHPDDGPPGPRPQYRDDYYGAFLRDPSGNSVEAVHHGARRRDGLVDHLWIRVADLAAATAFYRTVAAAAGLDLRHAGPERTTFGGGPAGGSFSLVPGPPTEHLHMAFPGDDDAVRRFFHDATAAGHRAGGPPGERPQYHPGYYAAYVFDPDGNNIEVVDHHRS